MYIRFQFSFDYEKKGKTCITDVEYIEKSRSGIILTRRRRRTQDTDSQRDVRGISPKYTSVFFSFPDFLFLKKKKFGRELAYLERLLFSTVPKSSSIIISKWRYF